MAMEIVKREKLGTRHSNALRTQGLVPAIVYGHGQENLPVALPGHDIGLAVRHGEHLVKGRIDGGEQNFLIKAVQYDHLGSEILHVDLTRVSLDERVEVTVPIVLRGTPIGVSAENGVLTQHQAQVRLECVVTEIPDEIRVPVGGLHVNDVVRVRDLLLPPNVKAMADPETLVASVSVLAEEVVAPVAEPVVGEPEVIGAKKEDGPEAEEEKPKKKEKE